MDRPKGLASLFLLACPCEADNALALLASCCAAAAPSVSALSWVLILPLLWAVRAVYYLDSGGPGLATALALAGIAALLAADQHCAAAAARAETAAQVGRRGASSSSPAERSGIAYFRPLSKAAGAASVQASSSSGAAASSGSHQQPRSGGLGSRSVSAPTPIHTCTHLWAAGRGPTCGSRG